MFWNNTEVNIIKEIDTADNWWCSSAVLFSVKNGKSLKIRLLQSIESKLTMLRSDSILLYLNYSPDNCRPYKTFFTLRVQRYEKVKN